MAIAICPQAMAISTIVSTKVVGISISLSLGLSISRPFAIVSTKTIAVVSKAISIGAVSQSIAVCPQAMAISAIVSTKVVRISISLGLGLSISRPLAIVSTKSIAVVSKAISVGAVSKSIAICP